MTVLQIGKFEHRFWLQILGDHSRFILESFSLTEEKGIETAKFFKNKFDELLEQVNGTTENDFIAFTKKAKGLTLDFREFKLSLLKRQLIGGIMLSLPPTFMNHMVNELEEYLRVTRYLEKGEKPPIFHELHHHLLWLMDAVGHAETIHDKMDPVEKELKLTSAKFTKKFEDFYIKAVEFAGYLRTNLESLPALKKMNDDVELEMKLFRTFLKELEDLELSNKALGIFSPLMADHMLREECYYLMKLAESTHTKLPNCNPAKKRIQD